MPDNQCPECGKIFNRMDSYRRHIQESHTYGMRYECTWPECNYYTFIKNSLQNHAVTEHLNPPIHQCDTDGSGPSNGPVNDSIFIKGAVKDTTEKLHPEPLGSQLPTPGNSSNSSNLSDPSVRSEDLHGTQAETDSRSRQAARPPPSVSVHKNRTDFIGSSEGNTQTQLPRLRDVLPEFFPPHLPPLRIRED